MGHYVLLCRTLFPNDHTGPWAGLFPVTRVLGPCTYKVRCNPCPMQWQVIHMSNLKGWVGPPPANTQVLAELCTDPEGECEGWVMDSSMPASQPPFGEALTPTKQGQLITLLKKFLQGFSATPGLTSAL